jgi:hypothetical protein
MIINGDNSIKIEKIHNKYFVEFFEIRYCYYDEKSDSVTQSKLYFDKLIKTAPEALLYIKQEQEKYIDRKYKYDLCYSYVTHDGSSDEATEWFINSINVNKNKII